MAGWGGAFVALFGLLLPSLVLMMILGIAFLRFKDLPFAQAMLTAVRPVVVALLAYTAYTVFPKGDQELAHRVDRVGGLCRRGLSQRASRADDPGGGDPGAGRLPVEHRLRTAYLYCVPTNPVQNTQYAEFPAALPPHHHSPARQPFYIHPECDIMIDMTKHRNTLPKPTMVTTASRP